MTPHDEMSAVLAALGQHTRPTVTITPVKEAPEAPWSSKFGGQPWWPRDLDYPHSASGNPLYLLAQINLAEAPALPGFPNRGLLQFFIANDEVYGFDFERSVAEKMVHRGFPGKAALIFRKKYSESRNP